MPRRNASDDEARQPMLHQEGGEPRGVVHDNEMIEPLTGCGGSACCNPSSLVHRLMALLFMCLVGFGKYRFICKLSCTIVFVY